MEKFWRWTVLMAAPREHAERHRTEHQIMVKTVNLRYVSFTVTMEKKQRVKAKACK